MNECKSKSREIERIFINRINADWYLSASTEIENHWYSYIAVSLGVYLKFNSQYFDEYQTKIIELLDKYTPYATLRFQELCDKHPDICEELIEDLKKAIGKATWYEENKIEKDKVPLVNQILHKYNDLILSQNDVSCYAYESEIEHVLGQGYVHARCIAKSFYERELYQMVFLKFYNDN